MINRRFNDRASCPARNNPKQALARKPPIHSPASGKADMRVLDDGFSWQGTHYRLLSAIARQITGSAWSGPLFFGLRLNHSAIHSPAQASVPVDPPLEAPNAAG
jgi:hypothetical protein